MSLTLQIAKGMDQKEVSSLFPSLYPTSVGVDRGTVCIPSPYADNGHADMSFYSLSVPENPAMAPPLSPSLFWPLHNTHTMPALSLQCPPALSYSEPQMPTTWVDTKPHTVGGNRWRGRGLTNLHLKMFNKTVSYIGMGIDNILLKPMPLLILLVCPILYVFLINFLYGNKSRPTQVFSVNTVIYELSVECLPKNVWTFKISVKGFAGWDLMGELSSWL